MFTLLAIAPMLAGFIVAALAAIVGAHKARQCSQRAQRLATLDTRALRRWQRANLARQACLTYSCPIRIKADYWASEALGAAMLAEAGSI